MEKRMHIQHVILSLEPGGLENGVVNVVNRLSTERFQSSICCLKQAGEFSARVNSTVKIYEMGGRGGIDLRMPFRLAQLFRKTRPDVVHTRNAEAFFYGFLAAKLAGVRCIVHSEHGRTFNDRPIRFRVQRWFSSHVQAMFSVSRQLRADLVKHVGIRETDMQVLYNGVDLDRFSLRERHAARNEMRVQEGELVIGSVGRLVSVKNYSLLLKAATKLSHKNVIIVLIGDGPDRDELQRLASSLNISGRVHFMGHRDDVSSLLCGMDIFVLPSLSEGMSNTLLEAMASGVVCVASDIGGNPEIVIHEQTGLLFPSGGESALTEQLERLANDSSLRRKLGQAARERMEKEFSILSMLKRYEDFYISALQKVGRR